MTSQEDDERDRAWQTGSLAYSDATELGQQTSVNSRLRHHLLHLRRILLLVVFVSIPATALMILLVLAYNRIREQHQSAAMAWCNQTVSTIDSYRAGHGVYPNRL